MQFFQPLTHIYLYDDPDTAGLDVDEIGGYLVSLLPWVEIHPRNDMITHHFRRFSDEERKVLEPELLAQLQRARVENATSLVVGEDAAVESFTDFIFNAAGLQSILRLLVPPEESDAEHLHLSFISHAIGSWRGEPPLFQLHAINLGEPAMISLPGLVEAIPRPKEYEFRRAQLAIFGADEEELEDLAEAFADRTLGYGDPRLNEVCKGYALMAVFYRMFGEAFCGDLHCRLHAARTQDALIKAQCRPKAGLCSRHAAMLESAGATQSPI